MNPLLPLVLGSLKALLLMLVAAGVALGLRGRPARLRGGGVGHRPCRLPRHPAGGAVAAGLVVAGACEHRAIRYTE